MSRIKLIIIGFMVIFMTGCSIVQPYVDRRRDAGQVGEKLYVGRSKPDAPVVCYNPWVTDFEELQRMADEECIKHKTGVRAEFIDKNKLSCSLFTPNYSNFKCIDE